MRYTRIRPSNPHIQENPFLICFVVSVLCFVNEWLRLQNESINNKHDYHEMSHNNDETSHVITNNNKIMTTIIFGLDPNMNFQPTTIACNQISNFKCIEPSWDNETCVGIQANHVLFQNFEMKREIEMKCHQHTTANYTDDELHQQTI